MENSAVATGLEKVHFHSNPKERHCLPGKSLGQRSLEGYCSWGRLATKQQKPEGQPYQQTVETDGGRENLPDLWPIGQNCGWAGDRQSVAGV